MWKSSDLVVNPSVSSNGPCRHDRRSVRRTRALVTLVHGVVTFFDHRTSLAKKVPFTTP